jgi:hypothetical protein
LVGEYFPGTLKKVGASESQLNGIIRSGDRRSEGQRFRAVVLEACLLILLVGFAWNLAVERR